MSILCHILNMWAQVNDFLALSVWVKWPHLRPRSWVWGEIAWDFRIFSREKWKYFTYKRRKQIPPWEQAGVDFSTVLHCLLALREDYRCQSISLDFQHPSRSDGCHFDTEKSCRLFHQWNVDEVIRTTLHKSLQSISRLNCCFLHLALTPSMLPIWKHLLRTIKSIPSLSIRHNGCDID